VGNPIENEDGTISDGIVPPLKECHVTQGFNNGSKHLGTDFAAAPDTHVFSPAAGVVKETRYHGGYGGTVIIEHTVAGKKFTSLLGHQKCAGSQVSYYAGYPCNTMVVKEGDTVFAGQHVSFVADKGMESGEKYPGSGTYWEPHLHWGAKDGAYNTGADTCCTQWGLCGYGAGSSECSKDWISEHWYNPIDLANNCVGAQVGTEVTGSLIAPGLVAPQDATAMPLGAVSFTWTGGSDEGDKHFTMRNIDTCLKVDGYDKLFVPGDSKVVELVDPGNYRWTVCIDHDWCLDGGCCAPANTFYACAAAVLTAPAADFSAPSDTVLFVWDEGEQGKQHFLKVRDSSKGDDGPALFDMAVSGGIQELVFDEPGTYEWSVYYEVEHCLDKSGCDCTNKVPIACNGESRSIEVLAVEPPSVTVIEPSAGQKVNAAQTLGIMWETESIIPVSHSRVDLISTEQGCQTNQIQANIWMTVPGQGDPGEAEWEVPTGLPEGSYLVRITVWSEDGLAGTGCSSPLIVKPCQPNCENKWCGPDGCGAVCAQCVFPQQCNEGKCACIGEQCTPFATKCSSTMVVQKCIQAGGCWDWSYSYSCPMGHSCEDGECMCQSSCWFKECGIDDCGIDCGSCHGSEYCINGFCEPDCDPSCEGKECGDNGCGGTCGYCSIPFVCAHGQCLPECTPQCLGKVCGPDDCNGSCGSCQDGCSTCKDGLCKQVEKCDDKNDCTKDICDNGECSHLPKGGGCDDGSVCTWLDQCVDGNCKGTFELNCDDHNECTFDWCNKKTGCSHMPDDKSCDDSNKCTTGDVCVQGWCVGFDTVDCDDHSTCTVDYCFPSQGCVHAPRFAPCDDGDPCTAEDQCFTGICYSEQVNDCDDYSVCTLDTCLPQLGCLHTAVSGLCSDNSVCTSDDKCLGGKCVGTPLDCDDGNPCTADECDPETACAVTPMQGPCEDGSLCTIGDWCEDGECVSGVEDCDDGIACTEDYCDPKVGCQHAPDDGMCSAGSFCLKGRCAAESGCVVEPLNVECDDGNACTVKDWCQSGQCVGGAKLNCDDSDPCSVDSCIAVTGCHFAQIECPSSEVCVAGECVPCVPGSSSCEGDILLSCDEGDVHQTDCSAQTLFCVEEDSFSAACTPFPPIDSTFADTVSPSGDTDGGPSIRDNKSASQEVSGNPRQDTGCHIFTGSAPRSGWLLVIFAVLSMLLLRLKRMESEYEE